MHREETPGAVQQDRPISGLPVNTDYLFADKKGNYNASIEKKRTKLLRKIGFLADFLDEGETIVFVTTGCSPFSAVEELTLGHLWVRWIKCALFVFTNKRIFHIPTTVRYKYRGSIAQILYQDCRRLFVKGAALRMEYHTGKKERFYGIPRGDRAIIRRLSIETPELAEPSTRPERNPLCPSCMQVLGPEPTPCSGCGLTFKTEAKAVKYSLLFPGGGYFYVRRWGLGILDAIGESYLLLITLLALGGAVFGEADAFFVFAIFGAALAFEKLLTVYHAKKFVAEFIPKGSMPSPTRRDVPPEQPPAPPTPERKQNLERVLSVR
jgi:hypothetical protein